MAHDLWLAGDPEADRLLSTDPFALVVGMLLDQQVPTATAFSGPLRIAERMGGFDVRAIANADPEEFAALTARSPAIHRYPAAMARRIQAVARAVVRDYDGDVTRLWTQGGDGNAPAAPIVLKRLRALPGFGNQTARIFLALLGKQYGVQPEGWRAAAGEYGEEGSERSVADVIDAASMERVRQAKRAGRGGDARGDGDTAQET